MTIYNTARITPTVEVKPGMGGAVVGSYMVENATAIKHLVFGDLSQNDTVDKVEVYVNSDAGSEATVSVYDGTAAGTLITGDAYVIALENGVLDCENAQLTTGSVTVKITSVGSADVAANVFYRYVGALGS